LARLYHVDVARHAAGAEPRWVDNLLARFDLPGVESSGQGSTRRISSVGIYHVALVARLTRSMGIALQPASALAVKLLAAPPGDPVLLLGDIELRFDRAAFTAAVDARVAEAVESVMPPRRGRPRRDR